MASTVHYCLALLLAAQISYAAVAPAVYNRTLIVEDLANCPVKSVPFNTNDFDATQVVTLAGVLETSNVTQTCQDAAAEKLINCFVDGEPLNSLAIMTGCCSRACAVALEDYVQAICEDPASESMQLGLSHTAKRCANYDAVCPGAAANATRAANTATAANRDNATAVAARSTQPAATEPAASPAATTPLAPNTNSALSVAAATCAAFVMAAGALVLAMH
ncbi:hypothetical protein COO60DRAFT_91752 [Scenedesmus sp. NREL 46B-D3]|nr:hypothetical protein COO60DRAFT_91752 [Scenedesmus sp. NREL 46B-D3]